MQHALDFSTMYDALNILQTEVKTFLDDITRILDAVNHQLKTKTMKTADTVHTIAANVQMNTIADRMQVQRPRRRSE